MAKEQKKTVTGKTSAPRRTPKVTTDDGVTTHDRVTTNDHVMNDDSVSTNGGVIVEAEDADEHRDRDAVVARRAYELYAARGYEDGHDLDDWLAAEREI